MGLTFKEDCADIRNSGVENVIKKLREFNCNLDLYDPWADRNEIKQIYDIYPNSYLSKNTYDGILIAIGHEKFKNMDIRAIKSLCKKNYIIYDLKYTFSKNQLISRL